MSAPLLPIINHLIQQNPEQQRALAKFAGKTVQINAAGLRLQGRIGAQGFLETANTAPDTALTFHNSAVQKILQGHKPGVGDIAVEGDLMLGMAVLTAFGGLRYDAGNDLARLFGSNAAENIGERAAAIGHTIKQIGRSIAEQIGEFAREPESPVVDQATLLEWLDEVDKLRDDVARLNARLDRLEKDIWL
ncbi:ubiquinone biosynthesis accessory factor UbiJ [Neisseria chenwenguii]|uniref:SCP2 domain-containing protein n=1 Tax=Neisseria chenwenguii TaxID=1853278 RepID=A0A220RZQ3_9NEIS|nr:SCP2 domain-containing protein [Neisseria chenwenguii]ASK26455.1 SCP2 domain-containing protein [Neisseria chenwenguii]ROV55897.1 SCP2 domain-containing protein [Neisseria chenwenguii]